MLPQDLHDYNDVAENYDLYLDVMNSNEANHGGFLDFYPNFQAIQMNTKDTDYTLRLEYINKQGKREKIYNAISYNPHTQVMSGNWKFETLDNNGEIIETRIRPLKMRQTYRQEMKYLLELTGYEIVNVYGGYHKETADSFAKNVIWCVRKK